MYPARQLQTFLVRRAALGAAIAIALAFGALPRTSWAQMPPDSSGYLTTADGARLFYEIYGKGRDTVIVPAGVLLSPTLSVLRDNLTLVFYDPRGRGKSDWIADAKRLTMADEVRDLEAVRATLGISRAGVIGFSYLGLVAALYAAEYPDRVTRLAQLGPMAPDELTSSRYAPPEGRARTDSANARLARARASASDTADFAAECRRWHDAFTPVYLGDPSAASQVPVALCANENETPKKFLWRIDQTMRSLPRRWDYSRKAAAIRVPTLVIQGDKDFAVSPDGARRWTELIPDARLIMLSGAGHLAYIERSDRVIPALDRFFQGNWPPEAMQLKTSR
ncbi:MAG TPA: alpha/beta hydrolase [Gemmatimonadaceae bacterium]|nr:alpha/beta hydrolase [Gemmatimonadaceae bacterium]